MKKGTIIFKNGVTIDFLCEDIYIETISYGNVIRCLRIEDGSGTHLPLHINPEEIAAVLCAEDTNTTRRVI